jgi:Heparinase II/III-like protein
MLASSAAFGTVNAQPRNILTNALSRVNGTAVFAAQKNWHPFPNASERTLWEKLPGALRKEYIRRGEEALAYTWPSLPAAIYLEYTQSGSRQSDRLSSERRQKVLDLVLAECMEGAGRFIPQIVTGVWLVCEETSWVGAAHIAEQKAGKGLPDKSEPIIDLFSGETANLLAWTSYLVGDRLNAVSPLITKRITSEVRERVLGPGLERDDFWWMHTDTIQPGHHINNWTPWISSNWLAAELILEDRDDYRAKAAAKIMTVLDRFLNFYPDDGGCDEGPSYWGHAGGSLFECLELLNSASDGKIDVYRHPLIGEIGRYIDRAHIAGSYYTNYGDAPAMVTIQAELVLRYGLKINDRDLAGLGAAAARQQHILKSGISGSLTRQLMFLFNLDLLQDQTAAERLRQDVWLPQSEMMAAREAANSAQGFYIAAQGGHNEQSHNHNDVGSYMLYADGEPVLIDAGVEAYTAKTFSPERYDIWTMQSAYHNLPTINGFMQSSGKQYAARNVRFRTVRDSVIFSLDIAGAYPAAAKIRTWNRTLTLDRRKGMVEISEAYRLDTAASDIVLNLMTPCTVVASEAGTLILRVNAAQPQHQAFDVALHYDGTAMMPQIETITLQDNRMRRVWGDALHRIVLRLKNPKQSDAVTISFDRRGK